MEVPMEQGSSEAVAASITTNANSTISSNLAATSTPAITTLVASGLSDVAAVVPSSAAMPAPKVQAPLRSRRMPAVDPNTLIPARRTSNRSIKRKKFDDELVESSLIKTERGGGRVKASASSSSLSSPSSLSSSSLTVTSSSSVQAGGHFTQVHNQTPSVGLVSHAVPSVSASTGQTVTSGTLGQITPLILSSPLASASTHTATSTLVQSQTVSARLVSEQVRDSKQSETPTAVKPPAEKRSKPSTGKSSQAKGVASKTSTGKGAGRGKATASSSKVVIQRPSHSKSKSKSKRSRKQKPGFPSLKDIGRWKPQDDLALITAVQQTNDLSAVHIGVKFSCRFTLKEVEERWYALLYDQSLSKIATEAARQLHSENVATIQGKALYSNAEEQLLGSVAATSQPSLDNFQNILQQHPDVFHPGRTAKTLHSHWLLMKQHHLLPDQNAQPLPRGDYILNLSDIEDFINDDDATETKEDAIEKELSLADQRNKREIRHLEQEMPKWHVLVDSVTGISMPDFDNQTLGVLRGRLVRYLMRSREISLGRATKDNHVDVDLALEGPAWKVSRRQGIIKLRNSGDFFIANEGKRPILVDGKPVLTGNKQKLNNNSVVEISCLRFTFLINQDVINSIRADNTKPVATSSVVS